MRLRRNVKYDFIIYNCLIGASICIFVSTNSYFKSLPEEDTFNNQVKEAIYELKNPSSNQENDKLEIEEPNILINVDKKKLIKDYLTLIEDNIEKNNYITSYMIKTWQDYEILESKFLRKITDTYYVYQTNIKINNINAILPTKKNEELSTSEYSIISLFVNILIKDNTSIVKTIEV